MTVLVEKQKTETRTHGFLHVGGYEDEIKAEES
jgi:ssRNA-specific RNase YbeY (16S rRNA maturation enzyme)